MSALRVRAANDLIERRAIPLLGSERVELDFIASLNMFVVRLLRAGLSRILVICDVHRYAQNFLGEYLKDGLLARTDEIWDQGDDAILISGLGVVRSTSVDADRRSLSWTHDAIVCASCSTIPRIAFPLSEFSKPGRYVLWIAADARGQRYACVRGKTLEEPKAVPEDRAWERVVDPSIEALVS